MISPAGKEEEEGMQYALASFFFFLPLYAEKDEHGNQSGANNKQQKEPLKRGPHLQIVSVATETRNDCGGQERASANRIDNVRFRENCTLLPCRGGGEEEAVRPRNFRNRSGEIFVCELIALTK